MRLSRPVFPTVSRATAILTLIVLTLIVLLLNIPAVAQSDQAVARVLGTNWQQLSRRAGMIFAGTVLTSPTQSLQIDRDVPAVEMSLHVDRAIAGVESGQIVTVHEWTGALSSHPALRPGEHVLLFLYPPSRLGLTSPVGGAQGQVRLDSTGATVIDRSATESRNSLKSQPVSPHTATLTELEHAIRVARGE